MARGKQNPPGSPEKEPGKAGAKDGKPDENELARRRREKEKASGTSVADRTDGDNGPEPEEELFPNGTLEGDSKISLKTLIKAGTKTTVKASLSTAEVPLTTGLLDPEQEYEVLVRVLPGAPVPVAKHKDASAGGDHRIEEFTLRQPLRAIHVQAAGAMYTREQVLDLMHEAGVKPETVTKLLGASAPESAAS